MDTNKTKQTTIKRYIYYREALEAARRLVHTSSGDQYVVRFFLGQRIEHLILIISFTTLAITGLAQTYYDTILGNLTLTVFGGIDSSRQIHHVAAFIFGIQSIYHLGNFLEDLFVRRYITRMLPAWNDITDLMQMLKFNVGLAKKQPLFDRYNFEEKAEYWALVWGTLVMGITGLMQLFPRLVTEIFPGWVIPVGRTLHRWEAILAVLAILTWHVYHTMIKTRNFSIFTGKMTIEQMEEEHPLELMYLEEASRALQNRSWPVLIEIKVPEGEQTAEVPSEEVGGSKPAEGIAQ